MLQKCLTTTMYYYETSEQLFIDVWEKYGAPEEVDDANIILDILNDIITASKHMVVLDHYSHINFDKIIKVEYDEEKSIFKLFWLDNNKYRLANLNHELSEMDEMIWMMSGYCTYEYIAIDINKIKFLKVDNHIFILIQSNMITEKELRKKIIGSNEVIEVVNCTDELYARYIFWEGNKDDLIKVECIANNLPYFVCVIQPKERIPSTVFSKRILLLHTLQEINERLDRVERALLCGDLDRDELFSKGNIIRNIMEYALKHFCVIFDIQIDIEQKYGYIELGDLRKKIKSKVGIEIAPGLIIKANELSHDSGKKYSVDDIIMFHGDVRGLIDGLQKYICEKEISLHKQTREREEEK